MKSLINTTLFFSIFSLLLLAACDQTDPQSTDSTTGNTEIGLTEAYADYFTIGAAVGYNHFNPQDSALLAKHFGSVTAENSMKVGPTIAAIDSFTFEAGDRLMKFAEDHNMKARGHTLVWYIQTPDFFYQDREGNDLSKEALLARQKEYIHTVLDHYRGKTYAWDVLNEAISDDSATYYRKSKWFEICGPDYISAAFRNAREADPNIKLFYNDYNLLNPTKRAKTHKLLKELLEDGVPIDGIGIQGHWTMHDVNEANLSETIDLFADLGLDVQITELDLSVYEHYHNTDWTTLKQETTPFTEALAQQQAAKYAEIFRTLIKKSDKVSAVTFWGISDKNTWLNNFPVKNRTDYPLFFNSERKKKLAFDSVMAINR